MAQARTGDALWKWILGGIVAGAAVLGLLIGAYAIGYDRGQDHPNAAAPAEPAPETTPTETQPTETQPTETGASEADVVAARRGALDSAGCAGCHSLDGSAGVGPTMKGLAGSTVTLDDGSTVTADDAYLERAITEPDAQVPEGFKAGIMSGAVASQKFDTRPDDVAALVAFVKAQG